MRARISEQDTKSAPYTNYRKYLIPEIEKHGNTIVAAGHEHTLQYHKINDVHYIVSGSGSKRGPLVKEDYTKFAYGNYGYALVDYYQNGEIWMSFYANDLTDENFIEVYRSKLK
jgi:predicted phosphodiesterase